MANIDFSRTDGAYKVIILMVLFNMLFIAKVAALAYLTHKAPPLHYVTLAKVAALAYPTYKAPQISPSNPRHTNSIENSNIM